MVFHQNWIKLGNNTSPSFIKFCWNTKKFYYIEHIYRRVHPFFPDFSPLVIHDEKKTRNRTQFFAWFEIAISDALVEIVDGDGQPMETLYYNPGSEIELTCIIRNRSHWSSKTLWLKDNYPLDLYHRSTVRYVPQFRQNSSKFAILLIFEYNNYILEMYGVLLKSIFSEIGVRTWVQVVSDLRKNWL